MGATLPTLTRYLTRHADHLSDAFGRLYAANTLGAIVGTIAAGFVLIELLGLTGRSSSAPPARGSAGAIALGLTDGSPGSRRPARRPRLASRVAGPVRIRPGDRAVAPPAGADGPLARDSMLRLGSRRVRLRADVARLPDRYGPGCSRPGPATHVRLHDDPRPVPHRDRARRDHLRRLRPRIRRPVGLLAAPSSRRRSSPSSAACSLIPGASTGILDVQGSSAGLLVRSSGRSPSSSCPRPSSWASASRPLGARRRRPTRGRRPGRPRSSRRTRSGRSSGRSSSRSS